MTEVVQSALGKRKEMETSAAADESVVFTCKVHSWQYSFNCKNCENDMEALRTTFKCKRHQYHYSECNDCKKNHGLFHSRFHPAFEDCPTCWKERDKRHAEEKEQRKRDGIEKRKQTMARKKLLATTF